MATETDIEIIQGATFNLSITWTTSDESPQPISLAGYRAIMQIRKKPGSAGDPLVSVTSDDMDSGIRLEPGSSTGLIAVRIPATSTALLVKDCAYDLFVIASADATEATRLLSGKVLVSKSVTVGT
jgi:hypothetical protein